MWCTKDECIADGQLLTVMSVIMLLGGAVVVLGGPVVTHLE